MLGGQDPRHLKLHRDHVARQRRKRWTLGPPPKKKQLHAVKEKYELSEQW